MNQKFAIIVLLTLLLTAVLFYTPGSIVSAAIPVEIQQKLDKIGTWDGITPLSELEGAYEDPSQQNVPYGRRSFYFTPWRSYMDTWDANKFLAVPGIVFNVEKEAAEAAAQLFSEAGIRSARVEIGWDSLDFDDETKLKSDNLDYMQKMLTALKNNNIRPLILLNFHSKMPTPGKSKSVTVTRNANAGDRSLYIADTSGIKEKYTGLKSLNAEMTYYPIITGVEAETGKLTLSAPLNRPVDAGNLELIELKYQPFSGDMFSDGSSNPAAQETVNGFMKYVQTVTTHAKQILGTDGAEDVGFDIEVFNELDSGGHFINMNSYYNPQLSFSSFPSYTKNGKTVAGAEIILPLTADYVKNPANGLPGVNVISGFSNRRHTESGSGIWLNQDGFSRHFYTAFDRERSYIYPGSPSYFAKLSETYVNARGNADTTPFIPVHTEAYPEQWFALYEADVVTHDLQPFPSLKPGHHRYSSPGQGHTAQYWMTSTNFIRDQFAGDLISESGVSRSDPRLAAVMHHTGTKNMLRTFTFYAHKGVKTVNLASAKESDTRLNVLPDAFFTELQNNGYRLNDSVRAKAGPQLAALRNLTNLMKSGTSVSTPRPLEVTKLTEHKPRLVYKGDGTQEHPDRYHRDNFAVLPYQLSDRRFAVGFYVVTRDTTHSWDAGKHVLDPARYDMPEQHFEITLSNIFGINAKVSVYDPINNSSIPAEVISTTDSTISVKVPSVDYPRFLMIEETKQGPVLQNPRLEKTNDGALFSFTPTVNGTSQITFGAYPDRTGSFVHNMTVQKDRRAVVHLPGMQEGHGIKVTYKSDHGIINEFPRWNHDTLGVVYANSPSVETYEVSNIEKTFDDKSVHLSWTNPEDASFKQVNIYRNGVLLTSTAATSYEDLTVQPGTAYVYKITVVNQANMESAGLVIPLTTDVPAPLLEVNNLNYTSTDKTITLTFDIPDVMKAVQIYRNGTRVANGYTQEIFTDNDVQQGVSYEYKVTALNAKGQETPGKTLSGVILTDTTNHTEVTNLKAEPTDKIINLSYEVPNGLTVNIYRNGSLIGSTDVSPYVDSAVQPEVTYSYRLKTVNSYGKESAGVIVSDVRLIDTSNPYEVANLSAEPTDKIIKLSYEVPNGLTVNIYRNGSLIGSTGVSPYVDSTVQPGVTYTYRLKAVNSYGKESAGVIVSDVRLIDTSNPYEVANLKAEPTETSIKLSYEVPNGLTVNIYRDGSLIGSTDVSPYVDSAVQPGMRYSYRLKTVNSYGKESAGVIVSEVRLIDTSNAIEVTNLKAEPDHTSIKLTYEVPVELSVNIYRNGGFISSVTSVVYTDSNVAHGFSYTYTLKTVNQYGKESAGVIVSDVQLIDTSNPYEVANLSAEPTDKIIKLSYEVPNGLTVNIYRNGSLIGSTDVSPYIDSAVQPGTPYSYSLKTVNSYGKESAGVIISDLRLIDTTNTIEVANLKAEPIDTGIKLSFELPAGFTVNIYRNGSFLNRISTSEFIDFNVLYDISYEYTIRTVNAFGKESTGIKIAGIKPQKSTGGKGGGGGGGGGFFIPPISPEPKNETVILKEGAGIITGTDHIGPTVTVDRDFLLNAISQNGKMNKFIIGINNESNIRVSIPDDLLTENKITIELESADYTVRLEKNYPKTLQISRIPGLVPANGFIPAFEPVRIILDKGSAVFTIKNINPQHRTGLYRSDEPAKKWEYVRNVASREISVEMDVTGGVYGVFDYQNGFTDTADHWAQNYIDDLASKFIINGVAKEQFSPESAVTRAEFVAMTVRLFSSENFSVAGHFKDVHEVDWFFEELNHAYVLGIAGGDEGNRFRPNEHISREEFVAIAVRSIEKKNGPVVLSEEELNHLLAAFRDSGEISPWAKEYIAKALKLGIISGTGDQRIGPRDNATRAESAKVIAETLEQIQD